MRNKLIESIRKSWPNAYFLKACLSVNSCLLLIAWAIYFGGRLTGDIPHPLDWPQPRGVWHSLSTNTPLGMVAATLYAILVYLFCFPAIYLLHGILYVLLRKEAVFLVYGIILALLSAAAGFSTIMRLYSLID